MSQTFMDLPAPNRKWGLSPSLSLDTSNFDDWVLGEISTSLDTLKIEINLGGDITVDGS
jgi:hypothetical protein